MDIFQLQLFRFYPELDLQTGGASLNYTYDQKRPRRHTYILGPLRYDY